MLSLSEHVTRHSPSTSPESANVWGVYEPDTGSVQYVAACPGTKCAALIDVVWNFDKQAFSTSNESVAQIEALIAEHGLDVEWVLDTHPHADHLMANARLARRLGAKNGIGEKVGEIAELLRGFYDLPDAFDVDRDFAHLFAKGDTFGIGELPVEVSFAPGHTLGSITFIVGSNAAFVRDTRMYPDYGTSRSDFTVGSAAALREAVQRSLELPDATRLFVGHDYGRGEREEPMWEATIAEHKRSNAYVHDGTVREDWMAVREGRGATLALPDRMLAALQVNLRTGQLPPKEDDDHSHLKIPRNRF